MGKSTISMVMFNSYVKLPEGYPVSFGPTQKPIPGARFRHLHRLHQRPATLGPQPRTEAVLHWNGAGGGIHGVGIMGKFTQEKPWFHWHKNEEFTWFKQQKTNNEELMINITIWILLGGHGWGYILLKGSAPCRRPLGISSVRVSLRTWHFGPLLRALWAVCLPAAKAHKRRLRHTDTAGPWGTDRACGPRPPVPNVAFWTDKKTSSLSCLSSSREGSQTAPSPHRNSRALKDGPGLRATAPSS